MRVAAATDLSSTGAAPGAAAWTPHLDEIHGFFGPGSLTWRVNREASCLLAGRRAVLLQLAHPLVAAGVAAHSSFRDSPVKRLARTLDLTQTIVFGTRREALGAAGAIRHAHRGVHGRLQRQLGPYPRGTRYNAANPDAAAWVLATLIDSALLAFRTFTGPLSRSEENRFLHEMKQFGAILRVPPAMLPSEIEEFRRWFRHRLASDVVVTSLARTFGDPILRPLSATADAAAPLTRLLMRPVSGWPRLLNVLTAGLLPAVVRDGYRMPWTALDRRAFTGAIRTIKRLQHVLPESARTMPLARSAERRVACCRCSHRARGVVTPVEEWRGSSIDPLSHGGQSGPRSSGAQADVAQGAVHVGRWSPASSGPPWLCPKGFWSSAR